MKSFSSSVCAVVIAVLSVQAPAAKPKRESIPIGGEWNLSGSIIEKTKQGERTERLVATGRPELKKGGNAVLGPWSLEATADRIECDFAGKRFILSGRYVVRKKMGEGAANVIEGTADDSKIELDFRGEGTRATGPNKVKLADVSVPAKDARRSVEKP